MKINKLSLLGNLIICLNSLAWTIYYFITDDITFGLIFSGLTFISILFTVANILYDYTQQLYKRIRRLEADINKLMENQQ